MAGRALALSRHTNIVLLVTTPDKWQTARSIRVAREFDRWLPIRICQGLNETEAVKQAVPTLSLVVIGGPARRWWPSAEQRMAERLRRHGRDVVFVAEEASCGDQPCGGSGRQEPIPIQARRASPMRNTPTCRETSDQ
jgi:hypothetical protein